MQQSTANPGVTSPPLSAGQTAADKNKKTTGPSFAQTQRWTDNVPRIPLERLLLDAYEFRGLKELGLYFAFFIAFAVFVWFQWSMKGPQFRSSVVESIRNWDTGNKWESSDLKEVESMPDAFQFTLGYLKAALNDTLLQNHTDTEVVLIGDYAEVHLAAITVDLNLDDCPKDTRNQTSCQANSWKYKECQSDALKQSRKDRMDAFNESSRWIKVPGEDEWQAVIVSRNENDSVSYKLFRTTQDFLQRVVEIEEKDGGMVMQYARVVKMQMLLSSAMAPDVVMVELVFNIRDEVFKRGLTPRLLILTVASQHEWWVYIIFAMSCTLCSVIIGRELRTWWRCYGQSGRPWMYFWFIWNLIQAVTLLGTTAFLLSFVWFAVSQPSRQKTCADYAAPSAAVLPALRSLAKMYTVYLYLGIVLIGLQGFCMVRYMRVHPGLKAFYMVFVLAFDTFKDFAFFVLYMFLVLGLLVFGMFQISGGNKLFVDYGTGLGAIARLQFQLLDFDEFTNLGLGFGSYAGFIYSMYWICVILLVVFVANILLAIFQHAYEKVKERSEFVEDSFPWLVVKRAAFNTCKTWHYCKILWQEFTKTENHKYDDLESEGTPLRLADEKRKLAHKYLNAILNKYKQTNSNEPKRMSSWDLLQARWLVSKKKIVVALTSYYTDYKDLRLVGPREKPIWAGRGGEIPLSYTRTGSQSVSSQNTPIIPDDTPPFLKTKWITQKELEELLTLVWTESQNTTPKLWLFRWIVPPYLLQLKKDKIPGVAATIFKVYLHTNAPRRGKEDEDILNEESEEHTTAARLEQLETHVKSLSTKLDRVTNLLKALVEQTPSSSA